MNKTITILKNCTQETLIIIAQNVIDVSELKTVFTDIRTLFVAQKAVDVFELKTGSTNFRNHIVAHEEIDIPKQKTSLPVNHSERSDYLSMNSKGFMNPCYHDHVIEHKIKILCTRFKIPSSTNTGVIISSRNGALA